MTAISDNKNLTTRATTTTTTPTTQHLCRTWSFGIRSGRHVHAPGSSSASCCFNGSVGLIEKRHISDTWKCGSLSFVVTYPPKDFKMKFANYRLAKVQELNAPGNHPPHTCTKSIERTDRKGSVVSFKIPLALWRCAVLIPIIPSTWYILKE